jgi:hypothetical protein
VTEEVETWIDQNIGRKVAISMSRPEASPVTGQLAGADKYGVTISRPARGTRAVECVKEVFVPWGAILHIIHTTR